MTTKTDPCLPVNNEPQLVDVYNIQVRSLYLWDATLSVYLDAGERKVREEYQVEINREKYLIVKDIDCKFYEVYLEAKGKWQEIKVDLMTLKGASYYVWEVLRGNKPLDPTPEDFEQPDVNFYPNSQEDNMSLGLQRFHAGELTPYNAPRTSSSVVIASNAPTFKDIDIEEALTLNLDFEIIEDIKQATLDNWLEQVEASTPKETQAEYLANMPQQQLVKYISSVPHKALGAMILDVMASASITQAQRIRIISTYGTIYRNRSAIIGKMGANLVRKGQ